MPTVPQRHWICPKCGHANTPRALRCQRCNLRRPMPDDPRRVERLP